MDFGSEEVKKIWHTTLDDYFLPLDSCTRVFDTEDARALAWILTGLRHEVSRLAKKQRRLKEYELLILDGPVDHGVSDNEEISMIDTLVTAADVLSEAEDSLFIQEVLSLLTPRQQKVITATVLEGLTEREVASKLSLSRSAVHSLKKQALSRLQKYFVLEEPTGK